MARFQRSRIIERLPFFGILTGMVLIGALSYASFSSLESFRFYRDWVDHTQRVRFALKHTALLISDAQSAVRAFAITNADISLAPLEKARAELPLELAELRRLIKDNPTQQATLQQLSDVLDALMQELTLAETWHRSLGDKAAVKVAPLDINAIAVGGQANMLLTTMQEEEDRLLLLREKQADSSADNTTLRIVFGSLAAFILLGLTYWLLQHEVYQRRRANAALVHASAELSARAAQLELVNKELESFSYSVSHDLRIPLRAVSGYAGMLTEDYESVLDAEGQRLLRVIRENSKRMGMLIDDLLAFSKLGRQSLSASAIDMLALADNVLAELAGQQVNHPFQLHIAPLPTAWGDRALLRQVWINLLSNAIKYSSKAAEPEVWISGMTTATECIYSVRDNGVGFDMAFYDKLFGVFQRLHSAEEFPGTGVGLAIVQRIVLRHAGRVWAESSPGQGATFYFALPLHVESAA